MSLWASGQRRRQPWGREAKVAAQSSPCLARAFPYPLILLEGTGGNAVSQAVLMWSAAFLLGTIGVLILWFGFFLFSPPFCQ